MWGGEERWRGFTKSWDVCMHVVGVYEHLYSVDMDSLEECYMLAYPGFHIPCLILRDAPEFPQLSLRSSAPVSILV